MISTPIIGELTHMIRNHHSSRLRALTAIAIAGTATVIVAGIVLWKTSSTDPVRTGEIFLQGLVRDRALETETRYSKDAGLRRIATNSGARTVDPIASVLDPDDLTTRSQEAALVDLIARHVAVRAHPTPDAYFALAAASPEYRWVDPSSDRNGPMIETVYQYHVQRPLPAGPITDRIQAFWRDVLVEHGFVIAEAGSGPLGFRCAIRKVRSPDFDRNAGVSYEDQDGMDYWFGLGAVAYSVPFLVPVENLPEAFEGRASVNIADCQAILRVANGRLMNWQSVWRWDEKIGTWVCAESTSRVARACVSFF